MSAQIREWQIGYVFPKGDFARNSKPGASTRCAAVSPTPPHGSAIESTPLSDWSNVHLLTVQADCLERWHRPGFLAIGDAAHVMSPVGGVGINMAIGDAVAATNVLADPRTLPLRRKTLTDEHLAGIQRKRMPATRLTQTVQARIQDTIVRRALRNLPFELPLPVRLLLAIPGLRTLPARLFALGLPRAHLDV